MKAFGFVLLLTICAIDCRKIVPINKNANIDFINMESGGGPRPNPARQPAPITPQKPEPPKTPVEQPKPVVTTLKPVVVTVPAIPIPSKPVQPSPAQGKPSQTLAPMTAKPGQAPVITTPASGNVKQLITYYDSKGQASVIRPYSYSQAVKQG